MGYSRERTNKMRQPGETTIVNPSACLLAHLRRTWGTSHKYTLLRPSIPFCGVYDTLDETLSNKTMMSTSPNPPNPFSWAINWNHSHWFVSNGNHTHARIASGHNACVCVLCNVSRSDTSVHPNGALRLWRRDIWTRHRPATTIHFISNFFFCFSQKLSSRCYQALRCDKHVDTRSASLPFFVANAEQKYTSNCQ